MSSQGFRNFLTIRTIASLLSLETKVVLETICKKCITTVYVIEIKVNELIQSKFLFTETDRKQYEC